MGAEQSAVPQGGNGAAPRRPPAWAKGNGGGYGTEQESTSLQAARKGKLQVSMCTWCSNGECETATNMESGLCSCPAQPAPSAAHGNGDLHLGYSSRQMRKLIRLLSNLTIWLRHSKQGNLDSCSVLQLLQGRVQVLPNQLPCFYARSSAQHRLKASKPNRKHRTAQPSYLTNFLHSSTKNCETIYSSSVSWKGEKKNPRPSVNQPNNREAMTVQLFLQCLFSLRPQHFYHDNSNQAHWESQVK